MHNKNAPAAPTTERFMTQVIDDQPCGRHRAPRGMGCWVLHGSLMDLAGICDYRAKKAGYRGKISESSLSRHRPKK